jgi:hypothetical protein
MGDVAKNLKLKPDQLSNIQTLELGEGKAVLTVK